ncbi:hypothetical protein [Clostridium estertheticum]|uniref:hypothetical protein n=1 Tax=Clostridium estertheticum TaxID=238834 RepID=UPI001C7DC430|nr:hypothetical protein [Clostridium estertheticum]MBX4266069.1 hypothetical protein [Clostridium estertheticum]WLC90017.1 hypothetical protein KTC95_07455 [Clostridium estertheticum]
MNLLKDILIEKREFDTVALKCDKEIVTYRLYISLFLNMLKDLLRNIIKVTLLLEILIGELNKSVTQDLVVKALSEPKIINIFVDTTLEFSLTYEYLKRFKANNRIYRVTASTSSSIIS